jgi:nucleotide-binding universal stress UspA family protein
MFHHILVPLDGSARAEEALPVAARIVRASGGKLTVLRVLPPFELGIYPVKSTMPPELPLKAEIAEANAYLAQVTSSDDLAGIDIQTSVLTGSPAQAIVLFEQLQHIDLVVMCSHGFTGFKRWWFGSVAQHVAQPSASTCLA